jgi:ribonuclease Z
VDEYLKLLATLKICFVNYPLALHEFDPAHFRGRAYETVFESRSHFITARPLDHRIFALGYRLEEKVKPGRFDLDRARALGVPAGPLYGQLQSGRSITLDDGRVIQPAEVLGPPRPGKAVTYCLDTRPCENAVRLAEGADWLIHEATYTTDLAEEARRFGHSTAAQAAQTARQARARRLLLTHFSSRYLDLRPLLDEARAIFSETFLAEDLMELDVE